MNKDETTCTFVSTRGIAKSCKYHPQWFINNPSNKPRINVMNEEGDTIYLQFDSVDIFAEMFLDKMSKPFKLISGNSDYTTPFDFRNAQKILNNDKVICWYSQNVCLNHPKLKHIPIGLDYHTLSSTTHNHEWGSPMSPLEQENMLLKTLSRFDTLEFVKNKHIACTNFHLAMDDPPRRKIFREPAFKALKDKECVRWLSKSTRNVFWNELNEYAFCICPFGNGLDTHRTWEVLILNRIPIVMKCELNKLFEDLPIVEVEDWSVLSKEFLLEKYAEILMNIKKGKYKFEKLTLKYWVDVINN